MSTTLITRVISKVYTNYYQILLRFDLKFFSLGKSGDDQKTHDSIKTYFRTHLLYLRSKLFSIKMYSNKHFVSNKLFQWMVNRVWH